MGICLVMMGYDDLLLRNFLGFLRWWGFGGEKGERRGT